VVKVKLDRLDEHTLKMSKEELLIELNDQIELTSEIMRLDREEIREWRLECVEMEFLFSILGSGDYCIHS